MPEKLKKVVKEIKLPFTATNFSYSNKEMDGKSLRMADGAEMFGEAGKLKKKGFFKKIFG